MRIIRHPEKSQLHRPVIALGTFDGVHLGHRKVISSAVKYAKKIGAHSAVITFDPHPQEIITPERGLKILTTLKEREELLCGLGVDSIVVFKFSRYLQRLDYSRFIERYLVKRLGIRAVFVGYDFAFGAQRSAGVAELKKAGRKYGFEVTAIPPVKVGHELPKSGKIREFLSQGNFNQAVKLLGHPYRLTGRVTRGEGRGAKLGFPTANLLVDSRKLIPCQGVYAGVALGRKCAVNIGSRPTFGSGEQLVEVHIIGFHGSLRGKSLTVDLNQRLRDEKQFSDVDKLRSQIGRDIKNIVR
jgi:riboflavin kinase/FMN adenylyltransferase